MKKRVVILGAVISGGGAAHTLGRLGAVNALPGSFMAALSAAVSVYLMTKLGLPVSTTQAIVGGIIGWNLFSETRTDITTLSTILSTWIICPILAACFAIILFKKLHRAACHIGRFGLFVRHPSRLRGNIVKETRSWFGGSGDRIRSPVPRVLVIVIAAFFEVRVISNIWL